MLKNVQMINLSVETSLSTCLDALKTRKYQTTFFGERRLLCVKRSQQEDCVVTLEVVIEAFSRYETKITILGKVTDRSLPWEVASEVSEVAAFLNQKVYTQNLTPSAFPLNALQVCIA